MAERIAIGLKKIIETILGLMLAVMVVLVFFNVVLRYGFNSGIAVSEELSRYVFVWMIFIGATMAVREHAHLGIDSVVRRLPRKGKVISAVICDACMLFASVLLFIGSWKQTVINMPTLSPVAGISMAFLYLPGVIASAAIGVLLLLHMYQVLFIGVSDDDLVLSSESEELANAEHAAEAAAHATPAHRSAHSRKSVESLP